MQLIKNIVFSKESKVLKLIQRAVDEPLTNSKKLELWQRVAGIRAKVGAPKADRINLEFRPIFWVGRWKKLQTRRVKRFFDLTVSLSLSLSLSLSHRHAHTHALSISLAGQDIPII